MDQDGDWQASVSINKEGGVVHLENRAHHKIEMGVKGHGSYLLCADKDDKARLRVFSGAKERGFTLLDEADHTRMMLTYEPEGPKLRFFDEKGNLALIKP
jgi:hypothetical protein